MDAQRNINRQTGFNLLEVVIGMAIFAIGLLALASMQGNLTRNQADATVRTVATHIAEEVIETRRGFGRIDTDPADLVPAYADIVDHTETVSVGGVNYVVITQVVDYYYDLVTDSFGTANPDGLLVSDFKQVAVTVSWGNTPGFKIANAQEISAVDIGSGNITLTEAISSITTQGSGRTQTQKESGTFSPDVTYTPGQNPDIVSLQLGPSRFKESTTPRPRVFRSDEIVESRFDVITYSQSEDGAQFLRREEFIGVSCECTLRAPPPSAAEAGRRPTTWVGDEYELGEYTVKPYGESALNQQSQYCDSCCRDHHDGGAVVGDTAAALFNPYRSNGDYISSGSFSGDHKHYGRDNQGTLVLAAADGDSYLEACRLVRVDGFMRVAQDFRQEGRNAFPQNFLDETAEVNSYSAWATSAVNSFENALAGDYEISPPSLPAAPVAPAVGGFPTSTTLPTLSGAETQQLRSRGVYVDYMRDDLRVAIDCLRSLPPTGEATDCDSATIQFDRIASKNPLEVIPFFDVQLTWLNRWTENPANSPIDTTNETVLTGNAHDRGVASRGAPAGASMVYSTGHRGNLGLTDTDPVEPNFTLELRSAPLMVSAVNGDIAPPPGTFVIKGQISSGVPGLNATSVQVEGINAGCNRTPGGYICEFTPAGEPISIKIFEYKKPGRQLAACSDTLSLLSNGVDANGRGFAYFDLAPAVPLDPEVSHDVWIQENGCSL